MLDVYKDTDWADMDYPDHTAFVMHRESYALAIFLFLDEELGIKFPKLNGQIHAGWQHTFKTPVTMDQLMDLAGGIDTMFTEEEVWFILPNLLLGRHKINQTSSSVNIRQPCIYWI